jgi:hypothetical protein
MDLKIIQWNCRSVISKKTDLIQLINKYNPMVIALSETWLKPEFLFRISGYNCVREDRPDGYGGVAILVKNNISFKCLSLPAHNLDNFNAVGVQIDHISIISVYVPYASSEVLSQDIEQLFSTLSNSFIILGDFNCHHQIWGSGLTNNNGEHLLEILDSHNLCVLNTGVPTRRTNPNENASAVDLSICTPSLASVMTWTPLSSSYGSDHFPLIISTPLNKPPTRLHNPRLKYRLSNADWVKFKNKVNSKMSDLPDISHAGISDCSDALTQCLLEAADETFPAKSRLSDKIPSPPWWDHECTESVKNRKIAEKKYNQCMSTENYEILCEVIKETRKLLKQKKTGWLEIILCFSFSYHVFFGSLA